MKQFFPFIALFAFLCLGYLYCAPPQNISPASSTQTAAPKEVYEQTEGSTEYNATMLIGLDDGGHLPNQDDARINRISKLLTEIQAHTKETPKEIAAATDSTADGIKKDFGKNVTRQQLLQDAKYFYDKLDKQVMARQKIKDVMLLVYTKYSN